MMSNNCYLPQLNSYFSILFWSLAPFLICVSYSSMSQQPDTVQKRGQMPRRNGSRETVSSDAAHMILLQQPSLLLATCQLPKPSSRKPSSSGKMINNTYLPILNSYPRIAPHPSKKPPDKSPSKHESQNLSKRACTEHKRDDAPVARSLPEQHHNKQPKLAFSTSGLPCSSTTTESLSSCSPTPVPSSQGSPSGSSLYHTASTYLSTRGSTSTRHRRFLNTVEILRQSGLLDITLRTQELLRQSNATEHDIAQLRQHTELLCQAASNPSGVTAWEHLRRSMAESGSYSEVKILQNEEIQSHPDPARPTESISAGDASSPLAAECSELLPSPCLTTITGQNQHCAVPQQSHSGQGRAIGAGSKSAEEFTLMPPNSSTG